MSDLQRETARIYRFPISARIGAVDSRKEIRPVAELDGRRVTKAAIGSGWYHEAAIEEAERERQR
jgi:hypothetical protein